MVEPSDPQRWQSQAPLAFVGGFGYPYPPNISRLVCPFQQFTTQLGQKRPTCLDHFFHTGTGHTRRTFVLRDVEQRSRHIRHQRRSLQQTKAFMHLVD